MTAPFEPTLEDLIDPVVVEAAWPEAMRSVVDVVAAAFSRELKMPKAEAEHAARLAAFSISESIGGVNLYIPSTRRLDEKLRQLRILKDSDTLTPAELAEKYGFTIQHIYHRLKAKN